jgi:hypothetical protein
MRANDRAVDANFFSGRLSIELPGSHISVKISRKQDSISPINFQAPNRCPVRLLLGDLPLHGKVQWHYLG